MKYKPQSAPFVCLIQITLLTVMAGLFGPMARSQAPKPEAAPATQSPAEKRYAPQEMIDDLNAMIRTMEEVHPDLYFYTPKKEIDAFKSEIIASLTKPLTEREFYTRAARLAAKIGDGHTSVSLSLPSLTAYSNNGGVFFPMTIKQTGQGLKVLQNYSDNPAIKPGDNIQSINGIPAGRLFGQLLEQVSGERLAYRTFVTERNFRLLLWANDVAPPFAVQYESQLAGKAETEIVQGLSRDGLAERQQRNGIQTQSAPYRYERLSDGIGYLDFRSMPGDKAAFESFLDVMFKLIKLEKPPGLIVDLRKNGGGSSSLGDSLLGYLTTKPYKMSSSKDWKVSRPYRELAASNPRFRPSDEYLKAKDGEIVVATSDLTKPEPNPLRFDGPVCFLIGPNTFSSAMMVANAVGDFKLATLIGEETGDPPSSFGELYFFNLPNSKLAINVSTARYVRANGDATDKNAVLPDIRVVPSEKDLENRVDTVLETARKWVIQQARVK